MGRFGRDLFLMLLQSATESLALDRVTLDAFDHIECSCQAWTREFLLITKVARPNLVWTSLTQQSWHVRRGAKSVSRRCGWGSAPVPAPRSVWYCCNASDRINLLRLIPSAPCLVLEPNAVIGKCTCPEWTAVVKSSTYENERWGLQV